MNQEMATTQGYQQVTVVTPVPSQPQARSDFLRRGVQVGGLALGLPCVICLSVAGCIFIISAVSILSVEAIDFDDFDFDDDDFHFDHSTPLKTVGIIMLLIGIGMIIGSIALCYLGKKEYKKFTQGNAGRVITPAPAASVTHTYAPNIAQVSPYPSPGIQQAAVYQPPAGGQFAPPVTYPGAPPAGQMPYASPPPVGQMPYSATPSGQMPYPVMSAGGKPPYSVAPGTYVAGVPPSVGQQQYSASPPYQTQAMAPAMTSKEGIPGEADLPGVYDRPPPYAP